jgi:hypothetical protein
MTIYPDGLIGFKQRGRDEMFIPITTVFRQAVARMAAHTAVDPNKPEKARKVNRGLLSTFGLK